MVLLNDVSAKQDINKVIFTGTNRPLLNRVFPDNVLSVCYPSMGKIPEGIMPHTTFTEMIEYERNRTVRSANLHLRQ